MQLVYLREIRGWIRGNQSWLQTDMLILFQYTAIIFIFQAFLFVSLRFSMHDLYRRPCIRWKNRTHFELEIRIPSFSRVA